MGEYFLIAIVLIFAVGMGVVVKMTVTHADETLAQLKPGGKAHGAFRNTMEERHD